MPAHLCRARRAFFILWAERAERRGGVAGARRVSRLDCSTGLSDAFDPVLGLPWRYHYTARISPVSPSIWRGHAVTRRPARVLRLGRDVYPVYRQPSTRGSGMSPSPPPPDSTAHAPASRPAAAAPRRLTVLRLSYGDRGTRPRYGLRSKFESQSARMPNIRKASPECSKAQSLLHFKAKFSFQHPISHLYR